MSVQNVVAVVLGDEASIETSRGQIIVVADWSSVMRPVVDEVLEKLRTGNDVRRVHPVGSLVAAPPRYKLAESIRDAVERLHPRVEWHFTKLRSMGRYPSFIATAAGGLVAFAAPTTGDAKELRRWGTPNKALYPELRVSDGWFNEKH